MKLTLEGLKNTQEWEAAGIALPSYDVEKVVATRLHGYTLVQETSSVFSSADWLTHFLQREKPTKVLPAWKLLTLT